ncbi:FGGY family carbohydrate kinase [Micromonospora sp. NPDC051196]|uniref:xylulokinase n=1 Tax=Micromonospora sp. NPDC051196 TaxID=3155281 RepID=UPI0034315B0C
MTEVVCVVDAGTTGIRCALVDDQGTVHGQHSRELVIDHPYPGHAEQSLPAMWDATAQLLRDIQALAAQAGHRIVALTLATQRASVAGLDKDLQPVTPLVLWMDQRGAGELATMRRSVDAHTYSRESGMPLSTMPALATLVWLRRHAPQEYAASAYFVGVQEWLLHKLAGGPPQVDRSCASWVGLLNLRQGRWSADLLDAFDIGEDRLPALRACSDVAGRLLDEVADLTGLPRRLPVYVGGGDQQCSAAGGGGVRPGAATVNLGTSATMVFPATARDAPEVAGFVRAAHIVEDHVSVEGTIPACGSVLRWLRTLLRYGDDDAAYERMSADADAVEPGARGLLFAPTMAGVGTPHWTAASGRMSGLDFAHGPGFLVRAAMEGIALQVRDVLRHLPPALAGPTLTAIGGGARSTVFCQVLADVTGTTVEVPAGDPQAAPLRGAALSAWVGLGRYDDLPHAAGPLLTAARRHRPDPTTAPVYDALYSRYLDMSGLAAA